VRGQEREHVARRDQVPGQRRGIQKLTAGPPETLHEKKLSQVIERDAGKQPGPAVFSAGA
jgi:hypothetical protein